MNTDAEAVFWRAIAYSKYEMVKEMIVRNHSLAAYRRDGENMVRISLRYFDEDIDIAFIEFLAALGIDKQEMAPFNTTMAFTAFIDAYRCKRRDISDYLAKEVPLTPLEQVIVAILDHDAAALRAHLARLSDVNVRGYNGRTMAHWAVQETVEILDMVLATGVDVNIADVRGETPLHLLCSRLLKTKPHQLDMIDMLVAHHADVNASMDGIRPITLAAAGHLDAFKRLLGHGAIVYKDEIRFIMKGAREYVEWPNVRLLLREYARERK